MKMNSNANHRYPVLISSRWIISGSEALAAGISTLTSGESPCMRQVSCQKMHAKKLSRRDLLRCLKVQHFLRIFYVLAGLQRNSPCGDVVLMDCSFEKKKSSLVLFLRQVLVESGRNQSYSSHRSCSYQCLIQWIASYSRDLPQYSQLMIRQLHLLYNAVM